MYYLIKRGQFYLLLSIKNMDESSHFFKNNDIIWAKRSAQQWWPGIICANQEEKESRKLYRVDYFGYPPMHSYLPLKKIIKYQDYPKLAVAEEKHRASPELKKAIAEASILLNTLQQSKNLPINQCSISSSHFESQSINASATKSEARTSLQPNSSTQIPLFSFIGEQKSKLAHNSTLNFNSKRHRLNRRKLSFKPIKNEELEELLKKYSLQNIPQVTKQKPKLQQKKLIKFLYKYLKKNYNRQQSMDLALKIKEESVKTLKQLHSCIQSHRASTLRKKIQSIG